MFLSLLFILAALFTWLSSKNLGLGLATLGFALPSYLIRFEFVGIPTTLLEVFVLLFVTVYFFRTRNWKVFRADTRILIPLGMLFLAATVGVFVAHNLVSALGIWKSYFVVPLLLFFVASDLLKQSENRSYLYTGLLGSGLLVSLFGIMQFFTGMALPAPWDFERRITSIFLYPNALGLFLGPLCVLSAIFATKEVGARRVGLWVITCMQFVAIILAQSEAAIGSVLLTLFIASLFSPWRRWSIGLTSVAIFLLFLSPLGGSVFSKLTFQDYSGQVRVSQWTETMHMLSDRPLLGAGLNGYPHAMISYHKATHLEIFQYPHSLLLNIWTELGLLGIVGFLWLAVVLCTLTMRERSLYTPAVLGGLLLLQMTIHGLVDVPYFKNDLSVMTWLFIALIVASYDAPRTRTA